MTRITDNQQLIMLVREQLSRVSRSKIAKSNKVKNDGRPVQTAGVSAAKQLAESGEFSVEELQRSVVQGLLTEEFGDGILNDARFQQAIDQIAQIIRDDPESSKLMQDSLRQLGVPE